MTRVKDGGSPLPLPPPQHPSTEMQESHPLPNLIAQN
jgi:hypothetical protein